MNFALEGNFKMKRIFLLVIILMVFPIVSATLAENFDSMKFSECELIDYGKTDTTEFAVTFGLTGGRWSPCQVIVDSQPLEPETRAIYNFDEFEGYGIVEFIYKENLTQLFILGRNSDALNRLLSLTVDYENNEELFSNEILYFKNADEAYGPEPMDCDGDPGIAPACLSETVLLSPYCDNGQVSIEMIECSCSGGACINDTSCFNGIQDAGEEGIDCGGSCAQECISYYCDGADIDQDGDVDLDDFGFIKADFGKDCRVVSCAESGRTDIDGDGEVELDDFTTLKEHMGEECIKEKGLATIGISTRSLIIAGVVIVILIVIGLYSLKKGRKKRR